MNIEFMPVQSSEDITRVADLAKSIWENHYPSIIGIDQTQYMISLFQSRPAITQQIESEQYLYFIICTAEEDVGYLSFTHEGMSLFLSKIYVKKEHQRKGISSRALLFLEDWCKKHHLSRIYLTVNRFNENAICAYEKYGFKIIRNQIKDIGQGYIMDDYVMEKWF